eukprot:906945_1
MSQQMTLKLQHPLIGPIALLVFIISAIFTHEMYSIHNVVISYPQAASIQNKQTIQDNIHYQHMSKLNRLRTIDTTHHDTCYEWDYFYSNLSFNFIVNINTTEWCDIGSINAICHDLYNTNASHRYHSASYIVCDIISFAKNGNECSAGGATFMMYLKANASQLGSASYLEGTVIDLFNGRYVGFVHTPYHNNNCNATYELSIRLDFTAFGGSFSCSLQYGKYASINSIMLKTMHRQQIDIMISDTRSSVSSNELAMYLDAQYEINNTNYTYFVNVYEDQNNNHYAWTKPHKISSQPQFIFNGLDLNDRAFQHNIFDQLFDTNHGQYMRNKWIHFMGKSRTYGLFQKFMDGMIKNDYEYLFTKHENDKDREAMYYFKDIHLLVTSKNHPNAGYFNASEHISEVVQFIKNTSKIADYWNFSVYSVPNVYCVNKGIHQAANMHTKSQLLFYQKTISSYLIGFIEQFEDVKMIMNDSYFDRLYFVWMKTT